MKHDVRLIFPLRDRWLAARASLAVMLSLGVLSLPVRACCDDFLSCAAAVATGGLSCAAEAAIQAIQSVIDALQQHRTESSDQINSVLAAQLSDCRSALAEMDTHVDQLIARIEKANQDAGGVTADDLTKKDTSQLAVANGGNASAKTKPTGKKLTSAGTGSLEVQGSRQAVYEASPNVEMLRAELASLATKQKQTKAELTQEIKEAEIAAKAAEIRALEVTSANILDPIDQAVAPLKDMLKHPLAITQDLQDAATFLSEVEAGFESIVTRVLDQAGSEIHAASELPNDLMAALEKEAQRAEAIVGALRRMSSVPTEEDRAAIVIKLDENEPQPATTFKPAAPRKFSAKMRKTMEANFTKRSAHLTSLLASIPKPVAKDTTAFRQKISTDFDAYFKGVPPAAARKKREELIAEAKVRYAKDPETLKALEKYLREEASARGVN